MPATLEQIVADALTLPEEARFQLIEKIEESLVGVADPYWEPADEEKAEWEQRSRNFRDGKTTLMTEDEFFARRRNRA